MQTIDIVKPAGIINSNKKTISYVMTNIIEEYDDFDLNLMKKYFETKDLDESNFTNI